METLLKDLPGLREEDVVYINAVLAILRRHFRPRPDCKYDEHILPANEGALQ